MSIRSAFSTERLQCSIAGHGITTGQFNIGFGFRVVTAPGSYPGMMSFQQGTALGPSNYYSIVTPDSGGSVCAHHAGGRFCTTDGSTGFVFTNNTNYWGVLSRNGTGLRLRVWAADSLSSTPLYDQNDTAGGWNGTWALIDTLTVGSIGATQNAINGHLWNIKLKAGTEWSNGQAIREMRRYGVQDKSAGVPMAWPLASQEQGRFGCDEWHLQLATNTLLPLSGAAKFTPSEYLGTFTEAPGPYLRQVVHAQETDATDTTSRAAAFPVDVLDGSLLDVWSSNGTGGGATVSSVADTPTNTYTQCTTVNDATNNQRATVHYAKNVKGGACTVTATFSVACGYRALICTEWVGLDDVNPLDGTTGGSYRLAATTGPYIAVNPVDATLVEGVLLGTFKDSSASDIGTVTYPRQTPAPAYHVDGFTPSDLTAAVEVAVVWSRFWHDEYVQINCSIPSARDVLCCMRCYRPRKAWVRAPIATDDFNRANGALGTSWDAAAGYGESAVLSNAAASSGTGDEAAFWNSGTFSDDQYSKARLVYTGTQGQSGIGLLVRGTAGSAFMWYLNTGLIYTLASGTPTGSGINRNPGAFAVGQEFRFEAIGANPTTLRCFKDDVQVGADVKMFTGPQSGGRPGIFTGTNAVQWDDWVGGKLVHADTVYVNTASTAGGSGLSNATSGADRAFPSLAVAEAALRQDLRSVTARKFVDTNIEEAFQGFEYDQVREVALDVLCDGTAADTTRVNFANTVGWGSDATHRLRCRTNGIPTGPTWDTSRYRLHGSSSYGEGMFEVNTALAFALDLQIRNDFTLNSQPKAILCTSGNAFDAYIYGGIGWTGGSGYNSNGSALGNGGGASTPYFLRVRNFLAISNDGCAIGLGYADATAQATVINLANVTAIDRGTQNVGQVVGIGFDSAVECRITNLLIQGAVIGSNFSASGAVVANTILTQDTTSPTTALRSKTVAFLDPTAGDYRLASVDNEAKDAGTDLTFDSYHPFNVDGEGYARVGLWDVGADQYHNPGDILQVPIARSQTYGAITVTTRRTPTPGNLLVAIVADSGGAPNALPPTGFRAGPYAYDSSNVDNLQAYYRVTLGGDTGVVAGTNGAGWMAVFEVKGPFAALPLNQRLPATGSIQVGGGAGTLASGTSSQTQGPSFALALWLGETWSRQEFLPYPIAFSGFSNGFTVCHISKINTGHNAFGWKVLPSATTFSTTATWTGGNNGMNVALGVGNFTIEETAPFAPGIARRMSSSAGGWK